VFGTHELPPSVLDGVDTTALYAAARVELEGPFRGLYDLANDPLEERDVGAAHPERVTRLLALLDHAEAAALERHIEHDDDREIDPATLDQLEKLGYVEGGAD
jgi:hypothetical protein